MHTTVAAGCLASSMSALAITIIVASTKMAAVALQSLHTATTSEIPMANTDTIVSTNFRLRGAASCCQATSQDR